MATSWGEWQRVHPRSDFTPIRGGGDEQFRSHGQTLPQAYPYHILSPELQTVIARNPRGEQWSQSARLVDSLRTRLSKAQRALTKEVAEWGRTNDRNHEQLERRNEDALLFFDNSIWRT